jgi:F-type H+/Na+-transporting ATPase subunit alpha
MAVSLFAANEGYLDDVDVKQVVQFEQALHDYMRSSKSELLEKINSTGSYGDEIKEALQQALEDFKANHSW